MRLREGRPARAGYRAKVHQKAAIRTLVFLSTNTAAVLLQREPLRYSLATCGVTSRGVCQAKALQGAAKFT